MGLALVAQIAKHLEAQGVPPTVFIGYSKLLGDKHPPQTWCWTRTFMVAALELTKESLMLRCFWSRDCWEAEFLYTWADLEQALGRLALLVGPKPDVKFLRPNKDIDYKGT